MKPLKLIAVFVAVISILNSCESSHNSISSKSDTMIIRSNVALFYYPDSTSLDTLKNELDEQTYLNAVSDYTHFMNIASKYMDSVKLERATATRGKVLKFICRDKSEYLVDTKTLIDFWGVILFSKYYKPKLIDITILDMEYNKYFH